MKTTIGVIIASALIVAAVGYLFDVRPGRAILDAADSHRLFAVDYTAEPPTFRVWDSQRKRWMVFEPSRLEEDR